MFPRQLVLVTLLVATLTPMLLGQDRRQRRRPVYPESAPWTEIGLDQGIDWIRDPEMFIDARRAKRTMTKKVDRTAMLDKAVARAKKENKLVMWYVYRIMAPYTVDPRRPPRAGLQMYRSPILDIYAQHVFFADPEVRNTIKQGFVPLRMVYDQPMAEKYELKPLKFVEPAVIFLDGDGKIVHYVERIRTFSAHWFDSLLRRVYKHHFDKGMEYARPVEATARMSVDDKKKLEVYSYAVRMRKERKPAVALKALDAVHGYESEALTERGLVLTLQGKHKEAIPVLEKAFRAKGSRSAEAGYLLGANERNLGHEAAANKIFTAVAEAHPDTTWGRKAKVNLMLGSDKQPVGPTMSGFEHITWLPQAAYEGLPRDTTWAGPKASPKQLAVQAVKFLLQQQREHGGFTGARYAYWSSPKITPNTWIAISALATAALTEFRDVDPQQIDPKVVDKAIAKAQEFLFDPNRLNRGQNEDVYADAYRLIFLARQARDAGPEHTRTILETMHGVIEEAGKRQRKTGFWAHEYPNAFCTGAMIWSLREAKAAGAKVPDEMVDKGIGALVSARAKNGAYVYGGAAGGRRKGVLKDASGRMPFCEGALFAHGRSDKQKLDFAFETFWKYFPRLEQVRRNDFHSDGELAGFFFFHDFFHTSEANKLLPAEQRRINNKKFLEILKEIPEMDGSFLDSHEFGRTYGTAMALLTLKNCLEE